MKKYLYILLAFGILGLAGCEKLAEDSAVANVNDGYADLTISFNAPTSQLSVTRSLQSDPKNEGKTWTNWEKFVDGALLYRVTIFVIDNSGKLVAYRNIYANSSDVNETNGFYENSAVNTSATTGVAVKATFDSSDPMHGDIERLKAGTYKVIAVANYAAVESDGNTYEGLGKVAEDDGNNNGLGDFTSLVEGVTTGLTDEGVFAGSEKFLNNSIISYKLNSGTDRVCKQLPQPLVMIRNVTLTNGDNQLEGTLSRTFARIRLDVKNNDQSAQIGVSSLSFQNNYASQNAYLFNDVTAGTANLYQNFALYSTTFGAIGVTSTDAITPAKTEIDRIPAGLTRTMLDCYILEGKIQSTFAFQFDATHWTAGTTGSTTANYHIESFYGYKNGTTESSDYYYGLLDFKVYIRDAAGSSSNYLLGSNTSSTSAQTGTVTVTSPGTVSDGTVLDPKYVWEIKLTSDATYSGSTTIGGVSCGIKRAVAEGTLQNLGSGLYLQPYDGSKDMTPKLADRPGALIYKINFDSSIENGTIFSLYNSEYYYLDSDDNHALTWVKYSGTSITTDAAANTSSNDKGHGNGNNQESGTAPAYEYLAFETIPGEAGKATTITIKKSIDNTTTSTEATENIIARNDFFWGTIPVSISDSSQRTTTDSTTTTE